MHPKGCFLFYVESPRIRVKQKIQQIRKKSFFMMTAMAILLNNERGVSREKIEKQNIIYGG